MTPTLSLGNSRIKGAEALHPWHVRMRVRILYAEHGMSSQNGWKGSLNSRVTEQLLTLEISCTLNDFKALVTSCPRHYNIFQSHSSLPNRLPGPESSLPNVGGTTYVLDGLRSDLQLNCDLVFHKKSVTQPAKAKGQRRRCPLVDQDSSQTEDRNQASLKIRSTDPISANSDNSNKKVSHAVSASRGRSCPSFCVLHHCPDANAVSSRRTNRYRDRGGPRRSLRRASDRHVQKTRTRAGRNNTVDGSNGDFCEVIATRPGGGRGAYVPVDNSMK